MGSIVTWQTNSMSWRFFFVSIDLSTSIRKISKWPELDTQLPPDTAINFLSFKKVTFITGLADDCPSLRRNFFLIEKLLLYNSINTPLSPLLGSRFRVVFIIFLLILLDWFGLTTNLFTILRKLKCHFIFIFFTMTNILITNITMTNFSNLLEEYLIMWSKILTQQ